MSAKLKEIDKLRAEIAEREDKLRELLYPEKEVQVVFPAGFSINDEILKMLKTAKGAVSAEQMHSALSKQYPKYKIDKKRIFSALAYLKNKRKEIESAGYGSYRLPQTQTTSANDGTSG